MVDCAEDLSHIWDARDVDALHRTRIREPRMLDRESTLRREGELGLECPVLESDLMGMNGEDKPFYKHGSVGVHPDSGECASVRHTAVHRHSAESVSALIQRYEAGNWSAGHTNSPQRVPGGANSETLAKESPTSIMNDTCGSTDNHVSHATLLHENAQLRMQLDAAQSFKRIDPVQSAAHPTDAAPVEPTGGDESQVFDRFAKIITNAVTNALSGVSFIACSDGRFRAQICPAFADSVLPVVVGHDVLDDDPSEIDDEPDWLKDAAMRIVQLDTPVQPEAVAHSQATCRNDVLSTGLASVRTVFTNSSPSL